MKELGCIGLQTQRIVIIVIIIVIIISTVSDN